MSPDKRLKISLIKKPTFRIDLSRINWKILVEAFSAGKNLNFIILDGLKKKSFDDFFSVQKDDREFEYQFITSHNHEDSPKKKILKYR